MDLDGTFNEGVEFTYKVKFEYGNPCLDDCVLFSFAFCS